MLENLKLKKDLTDQEIQDNLNINFNLKKFKNYC